MEFVYFIFIPAVLTPLRNIHKTFSMPAKVCHNLRIIFENFYSNLYLFVCRRYSSVVIVRAIVK